MTNNPADIKHYESVFDSVAHELIQLIDHTDTQLFVEYFSFRSKLQARAQQLYPDYDFENF